MDLDSCFRNPRRQEETTDENIDMSNLSQVATAASPRIVVDAMKITGNSPVAATAASSIAATFSAPGPTLIAAAYQNAAVHTPAQTMRFYKISVEMEALRRALEKTTRNTEEKTTIFPANRLIELMKHTLRKFCRKFYKEHIKLATKLTYSKHRKSKHVDILHKSKENTDKEQVKDNTESRLYEDENIIANA